MIAILEGSLDTAAAPETEKIMSPLNNVEGKDIIIDCKGLEYISSAGLRFFMQLKRESEAKGGKIRIINLNEDVADIFRMSGFKNIFEIE